MPLLVATLVSTFTGLVTWVLTWFALGALAQGPQVAVTYAYPLIETLVHVMALFFAPVAMVVGGTAVPVCVMLSRRGQARPSRLLPIGAVEGVVLTASVWWFMSDRWQFADIVVIPMGGLAGAAAAAAFWAVARRLGAGRRN